MNKTILHTLVGIALLSGLSGCLTIPEAEYADFKPLPRNQRVIQEVKLTWDVRPDASEVCSQSNKFIWNNLACCKRPQLRQQTERQKQTVQQA